MTVVDDYVIDYSITLVKQKVLLDLPFMVDNRMQS